MKPYTLNEDTAKLNGTIDTPERDIFEYELQLEMIGKQSEQYNFRHPIS